MAVQQHSKSMKSLIALISFLQLSPNNAELPNILRKAQSQVNKYLNLSGKINARTSLPAYERICSCPAFAVTTPWGSPYMIFDKLPSSEVARDKAVDNFFTGKDGNEAALSEYEEKVREQKSGLTDEQIAQDADMEKELAKQSFSSRTTALYFSDPDDAQLLVDEMKQMGNGMDRADIRVMATSLGRAVRQASGLGHGLPTGQPFNELNGRMENNAIRYKIVPSRRELYYAATRCLGKERVGLFGDSREDDVESALYSPRELAEARAAKGATAAVKRQSKKGAESSVRRQWRSMRGQTGIPVFYAEGMKRKVGKNDEEIPLFLSYEDLRSSWDNMAKSKNIENVEIPKKPPRVEVFNFMDIVVAMEHSQWRKRDALNKALNKVHSNPWVQNMLPARFIAARNNVPKIGDDDIDKIVFIPSSRTIQFKERTSKLGNGKARLRPMR